MFGHLISSIKVLLTKGAIPLESPPNCYLQCLVWRARIAGERPQVSRSCIRELIAFAQTIGDGKSAVIYKCPGRMLQSCSDDSNARQAFSRSFIEIAEGVSISSSVCAMGAETLSPQLPAGIYAENVPTSTSAVVAWPVVATN